MLIQGRSRVLVATPCSCLLTSSVHVLRVNVFKVLTFVSCVCFTRIVCASGAE